jgi:Fe-S-cluster containining protein
MRIHSSRGLLAASRQKNTLRGEEKTTSRSLANPRPREDHKLIQILDVALAGATERAGDWLVCHPGCTQCCKGVFEISQLDAARLRQGLAELKKLNLARAARIEERARATWQRLSASFPGNRRTGIVGKSAADQTRFERFANDEPCPALDPRTGLCDLYEWRPITCRTFGPPVREERGLGVCDLCFQGATDNEIAACEMKVDPDGLESKLIRKMERAGAPCGNTVVAFALTRGKS